MCARRRCGFRAEILHAGLGDIIESMYSQRSCNKPRPTSIIIVFHSERRLGGIPMLLMNILSSSLRFFHGKHLRHNFRPVIPLTITIRESSLQRQPGTVAITHVVYPR
jgi:hypothetical protein